MSLLRSLDLVTHISMCRDLWLMKKTRLFRWSTSNDRTSDPLNWGTTSRDEDLRLRCTSELLAPTYHSSGSSSDDKDQKNWLQCDLCEKPSTLPCVAVAEWLRRSLRTFRAIMCGFQVRTSPRPLDLPRLWQSTADLLLAYHSDSVNQYTDVDYERKTLIKLLNCVTQLVRLLQFLVLLAKLFIR